MKKYLEIFDLELKFSTGKFFMGWFWVIISLIMAYPTLRTMFIWLYEL